ncbi:MAG: hypothetical protein AB3N14_04610 [Flavobacteriaceae bacterium]
MKFSANVDADDIGNILFYQESQGELSITSDKIKLANFKGYIHDPNANTAFSNLSVSLGIVETDNFMLKHMLEKESEYRNGEFTYNAHKLTEQENKLQDKLGCESKEEFVKVVEDYVTSGFITYDRREHSKDIDKYVMSIQSMPTSPVVLSPKSLHALRDVNVEIDASPIAKQLVDSVSRPSELVR